MEFFLCARNKKNRPRLIKKAENESAKSNPAKTISVGNRAISSKAISAILSEFVSIFAIKQTSKRLVSEIIMGKKEEENSPGPNSLKAKAVSR